MPMNRPPNYYGPLKDTEQQVNDAQSNEQNRQQPDAGMERKPHPGASSGWAYHGGMVEQQASAREWVRASDQQRQELAEAEERKHKEATPEMTEKRQARYDRWTGRPLDANQSPELSRDSGQGRGR